MSKSEYRTRIYSEYATRFQDAVEVFDRAGSIRWGRAYDYYLRGWLPKDKGAVIVDLACGGGKLLWFLKEHGYHHLQGVDISHEQVQLARQVIPQVEEADALNFLAGEKNCFDLIMGLDIIEHFQKDEVLQFLDGCHGALKPGGRLILQTPNAESPWGSVIRYGDFTHEVCFTPNSLKRLMYMCGFRDVIIREQGPVPWGYSMKSSARFTMWQVIRFCLKMWNVAETGNSGSGIFSRVFVASGCREKN